LSGDGLRGFVGSNVIAIPPTGQTCCVPDWLLDRGIGLSKSWTENRLRTLELLYLAIFLAPECAFVLMALREYINDTRHVSELEWMLGKQDAAALAQVQEDIQARLVKEKAAL